MKNYKFLIIGYDAQWHHSRHLAKYLSEAGYDIINMDDQFHDAKKGVVDFTIPEDIDFVVSFQFTTRINFIKTNPKTYIIQYNAETYWNCGCMNPDFLVLAFPEMVARYTHHNPEIFDNLIDYAEFSIFLDPSLYYYDMPKTKSGIHFKGVLNSETPYIHAGQYRLYREAYKERKEFILNNPHLITYHPVKNRILHYNDNYPKLLGTFEACLVANAYMSYFSKRPLENCASGVINIIYTRDKFETAVYRRYGFRHMYNCVFVRNSVDLSNFYAISEERKQIIKENAYNLFLHNYTVEKVWDKIFQWVRGHIDPDVPCLPRGKWDFWDKPGDE